MELDALRTQWTEQGARIEAGLTLNRRLLTALSLDRARTALGRHARGLIVEGVIAGLLILWLGSFLYEHLWQLRFSVPAWLLQMFCIASLADIVRQAIAARGIDAGEPVAAFQKRVASLRVMAIRHVQGILLVSTLLWAPLLVVGLKAVFGIDAWRVFGGGYLAANALVGVAVIPVAIVLARRFAGRFGGAPWFRRLLDDIAGEPVREARAFIAEVVEFERAN